VVGFRLAQPLSGFAFEKIVHHVEASEGVTAWPETSFLVNLKRSLASVAVSWAFGLPVLTLLMIVNVVVHMALVVTVPLKLVVVALLVARDLCDVRIRACVADPERNCPGRASVCGRECRDELEPQLPMPSLWQALLQGLADEVPNPRSSPSNHVNLAPVGASTDKVSGTIQQHARNAWSSSTP